MKTLNRRQILRGAGVALSLPWMESLAPHLAHAQGTTRKRYVALYFPNGTANFWRPTAAGAGEAWKLSPILEPLLPVKKHVTVLSNVSNYSPFGGHVEPSHSNCGASTWTCVKPSGSGQANNGISVDQVIANKIGAATPLASIQVGLSTMNSSPDGLPGQHSRSMAWKSATEPLYKVINPQAVFDRLVAGRGTGMAMTPSEDLEAKKRRALRKSALDSVKDITDHVHGGLSHSDQIRLDQFLSSVRTLEQRVAAPEMQLPSSISCTPSPRPSMSVAVNALPPGYDRGTHAELMIDLVVMAFQCDITRVVSFMLDDARSDFVYNFLKVRNFSSTGSTPGTANVGGYHDLQHAGDTNNGFATIGWWNAERAAELAGKLAAIDEGGKSILDSSVITFCSGMKGGNHDARNLPIALIGSGGGVLKTDRHIAFASDQRLADVHLTVLQKVFGVTQTSFGASSGILPDLLA